jgi:Flp pilus assembly protein TadD
MSYPSVQLFVDRAQAARPDFRLTPQNAAVVSALCDRLEGLPLAIELAAARARVLTPAQMLERLESTLLSGGTRFELLVSPRRDVSTRHRTLRAAVEWSYHLLPPELQRFFVDLSVFRGGWPLEAAEAVAEQPLALEYLQQLQEGSLVVAEEASHGGAMRYRLLETLREFGDEQLSPGGRQELQQRHFRFFSAFVESRKDSACHTELISGWLAVLDAEYGNLRAALEWGLAAEPAAALQLARNMANFWHIRGHLGEAVAYLTRAARWESADTLVDRAAVLRYAGELAGYQAEYERARELLQEAARLGREISAQDPFGFELLGAALCNLGEVAMLQGDYEQARAFYQESLEVRQSCFPEIHSILSGPLAGLGDVARAQGDYRTARDYYKQSLAIFLQNDDLRHVTQRRLDLGFLACSGNDLVRAEALFTECLAVFREFGERSGIALALKGLGDVSLARAEYLAAQDLYRESLTLLADLGHRLEIAGMLERCARLAQAVGQLERAALLWSAAQALRTAIRAPLPPHEQPSRDALLDALRQALGEASFQAAWETGCRLPWPQAAAAALSDL